jgi:hypothetical protein
MIREGFLKTSSHRLLAALPDEIYLRLRYWHRLGSWPNLTYPLKFTEKLQWLKLNERTEKMALLADKLSFKKFVHETFGSQYAIPILNTGTRASEFRAEAVPDCPFVIKTNHDSGSTMLIPDQKKIDFGSVRRWIKQRLRRNFYLANREWEYKNIQPAWFTEPLLTDWSENPQLNDFKVHCFHGRPLFVQTIFDRGASVKENWFDFDWQPIEIRYFSREKACVEQPVCLDEMAQLAAKLSDGFAYARVDFYIHNNRPLLGEITFRPYGGFMKWVPDSADMMLGDLLDVRR